VLKGSSKGVKKEHSYPRQSARFYFDLSVFWFTLEFLWSGMITIVIQTLVKKFTGDEKDLYLGWTLAAGALISTIVCLVVGTISDRSRWSMGRRRPYIILGTVFSIPPLLLLAKVNSVPLLILDFCLIQLWVNVATSPYQAMMPDMVPKEHQGTASAYMGMSGLLGQLGGLVACGVLISRENGLVTIMAMQSALMVVTMLYTILRVPERSAADNQVKRAGVVTMLLDSFKVKPREYPDFFRLITSRFIINMGFYTCTQFLLYYVSDTLKAPNPSDVVTKIFVISTVSGLIGNFPAGILSDRMSKKLVIYVSAAVAGTAMLVFLLTQTVTVALGAAFILGIGLGAFLAVEWAFATNLLPEKDEAKYMGVWHVAFTVPQVIAPLAGGVVAYLFNKHIGAGTGYRAVLFLSIIYLFVGTLIIRPIRERVHRSLP
jgi:MFS family permease